jgi:iron complex outermembrane receptor protein
VPAQTELFARGPRDGPGTFETGDPTLQEERANSLEGTVRFKHERVAFEGSLWYTSFSNYIFGRLTGRTCDADGNCVDDDSQELKELEYTQVDATFRGAEGKATFGLGDTGSGRLRLDLLADVVRATIDHGGNVPRMPPYHVGAGLLGRLARRRCARPLLNEQPTWRSPRRRPTSSRRSCALRLAPDATARGAQARGRRAKSANSVRRNAVALNRDV